MKAFDAYGILAENEINSTIINGRYDFQKEQEKYLCEDILDKLIIDKSDEVLDIGCGSGDISYAISQLARKVSLCDNPKSLKRIKELHKESKFDFYPFNFLKADFKKLKFDKILCYSVIHYLNSEKELFQFIEKILNLLNIKGRALIGDIPNKDKLKRFLSSERGKNFFEDWEKIKKNSENKYAKVSDYFSNDINFVDINDSTVLKIISYVRSKGFNAYIYDQRSNLPFGNSREDIIITAKEFHF